MLALVLSLVLVGQDNYVKGYQPKAGDKLALVPSSGTSLYVASSFDNIPALDKAIKAKDTAHLDQMTGKGEIASFPADTPIVLIKSHVYKLPHDDVAEFRILEGSMKDKVFFCHVADVRMPDPAKQAGAKVAPTKPEVAAKAQPEKKAKREPLNEDQVLEDVRAAIKKAKAETARLPGLEQKKQKEKLMKAAIETVCKKHKATLDEVNTIATNAKVFINFDGQTFNIAGKRVK